RHRTSPKLAQQWQLGLDGLVFRLSHSSVFRNHEWGDSGIEPVGLEAVCAWPVPSRGVASDLDRLGVPAAGFNIYPSDGVAALACSFQKAWINLGRSFGAAAVARSWLVGRRTTLHAHAGRRTFCLGETL